MHSSEQQILRRLNWKDVVSNVCLQYLKIIEINEQKYVIRKNLTLLSFSSSFYVSGVRLLSFLPLHLTIFLFFSCHCYLFYLLLFVAYFLLCSISYFVLLPCCSTWFDPRQVSVPFKLPLCYFIRYWFMFWRFSYRSISYSAPLRFPLYFLQVCHLHYMYFTITTSFMISFHVKWIYLSSFRTVLFYKFSGLSLSFQKYCRLVLAWLYS